MTDSSSSSGRGCPARSSAAPEARAFGRCLALLLAICIPAAAQTQPDSQTVVRAEPGLNGQWAIQQWAPLRLIFRDSGPVKSVEVFCADAGPKFRLAALPAPVGESSIDTAVYPQIASRRWIVRLTRPNGQSADVPLELSNVSFSGYGGSIARQDGVQPSTSSFESPPQQMLLAAAREAWADLEDLAAAAFLATSRPLHVRGPLDTVVTVDSADVFGPPADAPLVQPPIGVPSFWPESMANVPDRPAMLALAILAGGLLAVAAIGLLLGRHSIIAAIATAAAMASVGAAVWHTQPRHVAATFEMVVHTGDRPLQTDVDQSRHDGMLPAAVRRQRWQCLAAYADGTFDIPIARNSPTPRVLVGQSTDLPDVTLPAEFDASGLPGRARLTRGQRLACTTVDYHFDGGTMHMAPAGSDADPAMVVQWSNWQIPLANAWLVYDTRAVPLPDISGTNGQVQATGSSEVAWDSAYTADPADPLEVQFRKRMLHYWTTRVFHGGRFWIIGFDPKPMQSESGVLRVPAMYAIDLGPIPDE